MCLRFLKNSAIQHLVFILITLEFVKCLSIDNKLNVIRSDCYERLAIGQKLHSRDIDKTLNLSTVQDCRLACTNEDVRCRTFSFGIGLKGNSTCELSQHVVKESQNLTPIGTVANLDFDLYIKKLGCKLVLTQETHHDQPKPQESNTNINDKNNSTQNFSTKIKNNALPTSKPPNQNNYQQNEEEHPQTLDSDQPIRVQSSLISVASGPGPLVHIVSPVFENPDRKRPFNYGTGKPYYPNRYTPNYDNINNSPYDRPVYDRDSYDYRPNPSPNQNKYEPQKPAYLNDRFGYDEDNFHANKKRPGYESSHVSVNHNEYEESHYYNYDKPHRPQIVPNRPYSDDPYYKPNRIPERPEGNYYDYQQYSPNNSPQRPMENAYIYGNKPKPPQQISDNKKPESNLEVAKGNNSNAYQQNSNKPTEIPKPPKNSYGDQTNSNRPNSIPNAPANNYNQNVKPTQPPKIPERPIYEDDGYAKPQRPSYNRPYETYDNVYYDSVLVQNRRNESYIYRPIYQQENPVEDNPYRPSKLPDIFSSYDQTISPLKPQRIPARPVQHNSYGPELNQRPTKIPSLPASDYEPTISDQRPYDYPQRPYDYPSRPYDYPQRPYDYPQRPYDYPQRPYDFPQRPYDVPTRPDQSSRPIETNYGPTLHRPVAVPDIPFNNFDNYDQTVNSQRPYDVPNRPQKRPTEVNSYGSEIHSNRPNKIPDSPSIASDSYGSNEQPQRPYDIPNKPQKQPNRPLETNSYGSELHRPSQIPDSPSTASDNYGSNEPPQRPYDRPNKPQKRPNRPLGTNNYGSELHRPSKIPESPLNTFDSYGQPQKPYDISSRPQKQPSRPAEPNNYGSDPHRPTKIPDSPQSTSDDYGEPQRPYNKPSRPQQLPNRPVEEHNNYGSKPNRPIKIPNSPSNDLGSYGNSGQTPYDVPNSNLNGIYFTVHTRRPPSYYYEDKYKYPTDNGNNFEYNPTYQDRHDDEISKYPTRNHNSDYPKITSEQPNRNDYLYPSDFDYYNRRPISQENSDYDYYRYKHRLHEFDYNQRYNNFLPWDYRFDQDKSYYGFRHQYRDDYDDQYYRRAVYSTEFKRPVYVPIPSDNQMKPDVALNDTMDNLNNTPSSTNLTVLTNSSNLNTNNSITSNPIPEDNEPKSHIRRPIVSERIGSHGETITSIITEITDKSDCKYYFSYLL